MSVNGNSAGKHCTHCRAFKPLQDFGPNQEHGDGRQSWCRSCTAAANRRGRAERKKRRTAEAQARALVLPPVKSPLPAVWRCERCQHWERRNGESGAVCPYCTVAMAAAVRPDPVPIQPHVFDEL